ncbi:hypothetical protein [Acetivibrio cellulolyticus]|uniref:hypothetical protein n=1 Tax=Acetivibrio cellulolyticus TaxID=35830 RepID=UPI0001E2E28C|nr:hypothetical protein [Acetivibrio cellulolyticus]
MLKVLGAIILFLLLIVPGFISERLFYLISRCKEKSFVIVGLIFDLFIFIINITGLFCFKGIKTVDDLAEHFYWVHFDKLYGLLSILAAIILGVILGIIGRFVCKKCHRIEI